MIDRSEVKREAFLNPYSLMVAYANATCADIPYSLMLIHELGGDREIQATASGIYIFKKG